MSNVKYFGMIFGNFCFFLFVFVDLVFVNLGKNKQIFSFRISPF